MVTTTKRRRKRQRLFEEQGGLCYYCKKLMFMDRVEGKGGWTPKRLMCTIEHLYDWHEPEQRAMARDKRNIKFTVAACWGCNNRRAAKRNALFQKPKVT